MSDIEKRLGRLESRTGGDAAPITPVFVDGPDEEPTAAWERAHPGEPFPTNPFIVYFIAPPDRPYGRA